MDTHLPSDSAAAVRTSSKMFSIPDVFEILANLLAQFRPFGEPSPQRSDEGAIALGRFGMGGLRDGL